jgi:hypothetical protein
VADEPADAGLLGREAKGGVVFVEQLRAVLVKLNASCPSHDACRPRRLMRPLMN